MIDKESSYVAIGKFKNRFNLCDGDIFLGSVDVETTDGKYVLADTCECVFSYNTAYQQSEIAILWNYSNEQLKRKGVAKGFNTNHHNFALDDNDLIILDERIVIAINLIRKE